MVVVDDQFCLIAHKCSQTGCWKFLAFCFYPCNHSSSWSPDNDSVPYIDQIISDLSSMFFLDIFDNFMQFYSIEFKLLGHFINFRVKCIF